MYEGRKFGIVRTLVDHESVCLEHLFELRSNIRISGLNFVKSREMLRNAAIVPGDEKCVGVGKILVDRCSPNAGRFGDVRHRHGKDSMLGNQSRNRIQNRVSNAVAMRFDRLTPQLRHHVSIQKGFFEDNMS